MWLLQKNGGARATLIHNKIFFLVLRHTVGVLNGWIHIRAGTKEVVGSRVKTPSLSNPLLGEHQTL